jgi:glutamate dehydrogenase
MDIIRIAGHDATRGVDEVARVYFAVGARFGLDRLRSWAAAIPAETPWQKTAQHALVEDLYLFQSAIAARAIAEDGHAGGDPVDGWLVKRTRSVERVDQLMHDFRAAGTVDFSMLTVAARQLRVLAES